MVLTAARALALPRLAVTALGVALMGGGPALDAHPLETPFAHIAVLCHWLPNDATAHHWHGDLGRVVGFDNRLDCIVAVTLATGARGEAVQVANRLANFLGLRRAHVY